MRRTLFPLPPPPTAHRTPPPPRLIRRPSGGALSSHRCPAAHLLRAPKSSGHNVCSDLRARRELLQERPESLRPALQIFRAAERNNHGKHFFSRRRHHGPLGIARGASV